MTTNERTNLEHSAASVFKRGIHVSGTHVEERCGVALRLQKYFTLGTKIFKFRC
jgi:hypothetical protein